MFDRPILYAKSTDGIMFKENKITYNNVFKPFHWNTHLFLFEKVDNVSIINNRFGKELDKETDIKVTLSSSEAIRLNNNK